MKTVKKFAALVLALMMVFALALTANAAEPGTVTINNVAAGVTYNFYRIYDVESVAHEGNAHHPIYVTNTKWSEFGKDQYVTINANNHVTGMESFTNDTAQAFAAAVVAAGKTVDKTVTAATSGTLEVTGLDYGYYVMTTSRTGENVKYTVFTLCDAAFPIEDKNTSDLPDFEKFVQEDSTSDWGETNDADIGQVISFKLVVTAAAGTDTYTITDTMTNMEFIGLTSVTFNPKTVNTAVPADKYTITPSSGGDTFTFVLNDDYRKTLNDGDVIEIIYTAKLTEDAVIAGDGNPNTAKLTYNTDKTITDTTTTKTFQVTVNKTDEDGKALAGATFVLMNGNGQFYCNTNGAVTWVAAEAEATKYTSDANGALTFKGIDSGSYNLKETQAPAGYVLPVEVSAVTVAGDSQTVAITNTKGTELPSTGGMGTTLFYVVGGLMVASAAILLATKKRVTEV